MQVSAVSVEVAHNVQAAEVFHHVGWPCSHSTYGSPAISTRAVLRDRRVETPRTSPAAADALLRCCLLRCCLPYVCTFQLQMPGGELQSTSRALGFPCTCASVVNACVHARRAYAVATDADLKHAWVDFPFCFIDLLVGTSYSVHMCCDEHLVLPTT